jgi:hypothetical protein
MFDITVFKRSAMLVFLALKRARHGEIVKANLPLFYMAVKYMVLENRVLMRIFRPDREDVTGGCRYCMRSSIICTLLQILLGLSN